MIRSSFSSTPQPAAESPRETQRLPSEFVEAVCSAANASVVQVIGEHVQLKQAGKTYVGSCPFHSERTPSFHVWPGSGCHCFGCGAGGDAVKFLQEHLGMSFREVVLHLAPRLGIAIPQNVRAYLDRQPRDERRAARPVLSMFKPPQTIREKEQPRVNLKEVYRSVREVAGAYAANLSAETAQAQAARQWFASRGISREVWERYGCGLAPAGWRNLDSVLGVGYLNDPVHEVSGVVRLRERTKESGNDAEKVTQTTRYDYFRDRVMFTVRNENGEPIAMGGRANNKDDPVRYLNSPASPIFDKGETLYGLYEALPALRRPQPPAVVVVEGYMDVLSLVQNDIEAAVATMGTAIREEHIQKLEPHCRDVVFMFDGDAAGKGAMWKAALKALAYSDRFRFRFVSVPDDLDPDEWIRRDGSDVVRAAIEKAVPLGHYFLQRLKQKHPGERLEDYMAQAKEGMELLDVIPRTGPGYMAIVQQLREQCDDVGTAWPSTVPPPSSRSTISPEERLLQAASDQPELAYQLLPAYRGLMDHTDPDHLNLLARFERNIHHGLNFGCTKGVMSNELSCATLAAGPELIASFSSALEENRLKARLEKGEINERDYLRTASIREIG